MLRKNKFKIALLGSFEEIIKFIAATTAVLRNRTHIHELDIDDNHFEIVFGNEIELYSCVINHECEIKPHFGSRSPLAAIVYINAEIEDFLWQKKYKAIWENNSDNNGKYRKSTCIAIDFDSTKHTPIACLRAIPGLVQANSDEKIKSKAMLLHTGSQDEGCILSEIPRDIISLLSCTLFHVSKNQKPLVSELPGNESESLSP